MSFEDKPYLFPVVFAGLWLFMSAFFSFLSGWSALAGQFRARERPDGIRIRSQVKQIGLAPENQVTHMVVSSGGLYLYASIFFRFMHPPLLIPWSSVGKPREVNGLWWKTYEYDLGLTTTIRVTKSAHEQIESVRR
jgi:hypothetical protein